MYRNKRGPGMVCPNCGRVNDYGERCECERIEAEHAAEHQIHIKRKRRSAQASAYENGYERAMMEFYYA